MKLVRGVGLIKVNLLGSSQIAVITSKRQYNRFLKKNQVSGLPSFVGSRGSATRLYKKGEVFFIIVLNSKELTTLCHEAVHMAQFILEGIGAKTGVSNTEVVAYLTDYIFGHLVKIVNS